MPFLGVEPVQEFASVAKQTITGDGSTAYTLTHSVGSANDLAVFVNNVRQEPTTAYSASGGTITFTEAIASTDSCYVVYLARTFQTLSPPDNSVGTTELKSSLDLSGKTLTFANNQISGNAVDGGTISNFTSTGIDDNADATAITIDSSENVGIGTASPSSTGSNYGSLTLSGSAGGEVFVATGGTTKGVLFNYSADANNVGLAATDSSGDLLFSTGGFSERMRIDSTGNVGIGTASTSAIRLTSLTSTANHIAAQIENSNTADSFGLVVKGGNDANDYAADFRKRDNTNIMRIRGDGSVGIGTTSPAHELHIAGTEPNIRLESGGTPSALYGLEITNGSTVDGYFRSRGATGETQIGSGRSSGWGGHLTFYTDSSERMRIDSNGYVTKPQTPVFSYGAYTTYDVSGTGTQVVSTSTVWNNSSYVHLNYNNGSHFNASNGRFTAPVAGIYRFDYRCGLADHSSGYFWWYIYKNSTAIAYWQSTQGMSSGSDDVALAYLQVYINLAANDYVEVKWANNYASGTVYYPHFSGALVA